jgi:hypothetical protein
MRCTTTLVASCLLASASSAAVISVNPDGSGDYTTIHEAAEAAMSGDTIQVAAGTYNETVLIDKPLHLAGAGMGETILNPPDPKSDFEVMMPGIRVVSISGEVADCSITGMTISDFGHDVPGAQPKGGGIGCYNAKVTIEQVEMKDNMSYASGGGGLYMIQSMVVLRDCVIEGNTTAANGAGIHMAAPSTCPMGAGYGLEIHDSRIAGNILSNNGESTSPKAGGGIYLPSTANPMCGSLNYTFRMQNTVVESNKIIGLEADQNWQPTGAGIYFDGMGIPPNWNPEVAENPILLLECTVRNNMGRSGPEGIEYAADLGVGGDSFVGSNFATWFNPWSGACCLGDSCITALEADCEMAGGSYAGDGTMCCCVPCESTCPADTDGDGTVDINDLLTVIAGWGSCP